MSGRWAGTAAVATAFALLATWSATASGAARTFEQRFATNDTGDVAIVANTLLTCPAADAQCPAAQAGTASPASANNNNAYAMRYVNADPAGGPGIFNSSGADLALPPGATVLKAMLYFGGDSGSGDGGAPPPNAAARDTVQLKVPGASSYQTLLAAQLDFLTTDGNDFQGAVDVTSQVGAAGSGTYWVGNVQAGTGRDRDAGWSLVVAYRDTSQPPRNLSIFDGFQVVNSGNRNVTIGVDGFKTPPTGAVSTQLGFVAYEGDAGSTGDSAKLNTTTLRDATNPAGNFFNSAISHGGVQFTAKDPNYVNQLGYDSIVADASGILGNGDTSAAIRLTTGGETYFPGVVTFATELIAPDVELSKAVQDLDGGSVEVGDVLRYTVRATNDGPDDATNVVLTDVVPDRTALVPGSLTIDGTANPPEASYDPSNRTIAYHVGTGATPTRGGILAGGGSAVVTFDVTVGSSPDGTQLVNAAHAAFFARTLGAPLTADSNAVTSTVAAPDLTIAKTPASFNAVGGGTVDFELSVTNSGAAATDGSGVTVTDDFPGGLGRAFDEVVAVGGTGWTCTPAVLPAAAPVSVECSRADRLAAGASYPAIGITARAADPPPLGNIANTAIVMGGGDGDTSNNAGTNVGQATTRADLSLLKTAAPLATLTGEQVTFRLRVRNHGPSLATGVVLDDLLPAGLSADTASTSQGTCSTGPVVCSLGDLPVGAEADVTVVATATASAPGPLVATNVAEVRSAVTDPVTDNNASLASVTIAPTADVSIVKQASPDPLDSTAPATFTLSVRNDGPQSAAAVTVTDPLPAGFVFGSAVGSQGGPCTHAPADDTVQCPLGPLAAGADATVAISGTLLPATEGTVLSNSAVVTSATGDPDLTDNAATVSALVIPAADVELVKTVDEAAPRAGGRVTYGLTVTNNGPSSALDVEVTDALPPGLTLVSAPGCSAAGATLTCAAGTLADGATRTFAVTATVATTLAGQELTNLASAGSDTPDPLTANNGDDATIAVTPRDPEPPRPPEPPGPPTTPIPPPGGGPASPASADLALTKRVLGRAVVGARLRYELVVANRGPQAASDVVVSDTLPRSVRFVSATTAAGRCAGAPALRCRLGTLPSGARATIALTVVPRTAGALVNVASASTATADPNAANDDAGARVVVAAQPTRLVLSKTADRRTVRTGGLVRFTIAVRVAGPGDARALRVCDRLPAGLSYRSAPGARMRRGSACWSRGRVAAGRTLRFALTARVARTARPGTLANSAVAVGANVRAAVRAQARVEVLPAARSGRGGGVTG